METFDIGIIGGGPAGYTSALYFAQQGQKVVLFERNQLGGTCLNKGCIPTKAFLHVAELYSDILNSKDIGINTNEVSLDFEKIKEFKNNIVLKLRRGLELTLKKAGVFVVNENAEIISKGIIKTKNEEYLCSDIIIATGSKPKEIKNLKFDNNFILSSDDILELNKLPKSILIVGSGAIGIEWARILSSFNSDVCIVELADRLCPNADWEVSKRLERQFKLKKIKTYLSTSITEIKDKKVKLSNNEILEPDCVLIAVGRETIIPENNYKYTVIGDASSEIMLAHYAISQAKEYALNIPFNKNFVPSVIYGEPEIAWIGEISKSKENDEKYNKSTFLISALGKAHCDNKTDGFIKILSENDKIKGASIVSKEASALIQQIAIAMENNLSINDIKKVCFAHPTYSEGIFEGIMNL